MDTHAHTEPAIVGSGVKNPYHLVEPSPWPIIGAMGGFCLVFGIILAAHFGSYLLLGVGVVLIAATMVGWWRAVLSESRVPGLHSKLVQLGMRYGMMLFITSEVLFFVSFFWAWFNFAIYPDNVSGQANPVWPPAGVTTFDPFHLPFLNTMILLLSGTTITWAHHSLLERDKRGLVMGLGLTVLLGMTFTLCQAIEYSDAPFKFVGGGIYPSVFFLATGFHGFHVIVGTIFLIVCWFRARSDDFTVERHFGFEAAAWYWHFVDVVWLFLFVCIYYFGAGHIEAHIGG